MKSLNYCRISEYHTELPDGYLAQMDAAERLLAAGFTQHKCLGCRRLVIWLRPSGRRLMRYENVSKKIRGVEHD